MVLVAFGGASALGYTTPNDDGRETSITIGTDGFAIISHREDTTAVWW